MSIRKELSGKKILITGASGFLGKTLLEKLLWEVPDVSEVRLLVRPGKENSDRHESARLRIINDIQTSPAFKRLRERETDLIQFLDKKIRVLPCDFLQEDLGLSREDQNIISNDLDAVIHIAATVSWDERFDYSIRANSLGTNRLLKMVQACSPVPRFVHISSAYVHGQRTGRVLETAFDPEKSIANELGSSELFQIESEIRQALDRADQVEKESKRADQIRKFEQEIYLRSGVTVDSGGNGISDQVENLRRKYVRSILSDYGIERARRHGWIDSYTFSKAMAEMLLIKNRRAVPLAIIRPPGITSALKDPDTGWLEGYHLTEPLIEGLGRGLIKVFPGLPESVIDTVPVDCVVNLILAAAATLKDASKPYIYQIATSDLNPITLGEIERTWRNYFNQYPLNDSKGKPVTVHPARLVADPVRFVKGIRQRYGIPLSIAENLLHRLSWAKKIGSYRKLLGWVVRSRKRLERVTRFSDLYSTYTINSWCFVSDNTRKLLSELSGEDLERFNFDVKRINWTEFWSEIHIPGMRRYVLRKESPAKAAA